jgi:hypothetical protein
MAAGAADTALLSLLRARAFILSALAACIIAAAIRIGLPPAEIAIRVAAVLAGVWIISFIHLRHVWLSLLAAVAPLPGGLVMFALSADVASLVAGYALGLSVALFAADEIAVRIADAVSPKAAAAGTLKDFGPAAIAVFAIALLLPLALHLTMGGFVVSWLDPAVAVLSAILIVPLAAPSLRFGESFVTRFNRMRERQERLVTPLLPVAHARWGASVAGVGIVVCALGYFGSAKLLVAAELHQLPLAILLAAVIAGTGAFWPTRDWRRACAIVLSFAPAVLMALWAMARLHVPIAEATLPFFARVALEGFALVLFGAVQAANNMRAGNDMGLASARAMERKAGITVVAAAASVLALSAGSSDPGVSIVLLTFSAIAAILFQPAFAISVETIFPRRATVEARYRVR